MKNKGCRKSTVINYYSLPTFGFFYCDVLKTLKENSGLCRHTAQCSIFAPPCLDYLPQLKCWLNGRYFDTQDQVWFPWFFPVSLLIWKFSVLKHISVKSCKWKNHFNNSSWSPLKLKAMISQWHTSKYVCADVVKEETNNGLLDYNIYSGICGLVNKSGVLFFCWFVT